MITFYGLPTKYQYMIGKSFIFACILFKIPE